MEEVLRHPQRVLKGAAKVVKVVEKVVAKEAKEARVQRAKMKKKPNESSSKGKTSGEDVGTPGSYSAKLTQSHRSHHQ